MNKPERGNKRSCPHCKARFYDLNRSPVICPKCKTEFTGDRVVKKSKGKQKEEEAREAVLETAVAKPPVDATDDVDEADDLDEVDDLDVDVDDDVDFDVDAADNPMIEGADDLDDDDDVPAFNADLDDDERE